MKRQSIVRSHEGQLDVDGRKFNEDIYKRIVANLKKEYAGDQPVWVTGYANDVMAYIPSLSVLREGGYEGDTSMVPYGMPTKWAPPIEELIVGKVHELAKAVQDPARARP